MEKHSLLISEDVCGILVSICRSIVRHSQIIRPAFQFIKPYLPTSMPFQHQLDNLSIRILYRPTCSTNYSCRFASQMPFDLGLLEGEAGDCVQCPTD